MSRTLSKCARCKAQPADDGYKTCGRCREYRRSNQSMTTTERNAQRRAANRALVRAARERPCVDCGIDWLPASVMHLDHALGAKEFKLSRCMGASRSKLIRELEKCETRCPNCHGLRHYLENQKENVQ